MALRRWVVSLVLALAACGGSDEPEEPIAVSTRPLAGRIGGQAWTFAHGETTASLSSGPKYFTSLFGDGAPGCGAYSTADRALVFVPKVPGDYPFSTQQTGTFFVEGTNRIAMRGRLIVEQVDAASVTARVHMIADADNEIDGEFVVSVCP